MTLKTEQTLKKYSAHFDLEVRNLNDLPDNVAGFLEPGSDPRHIFVNGRKSPSDQAFTIAHEMGHYVMHLDRLPRYVTPWFLDYPWKSELMIEAVQMTKNFRQRILNPEREADAWAFVFLWQAGATDDLLTIHEMYPDKRWLMWYSGVVALCNGHWQRSKDFLQRLCDRSGAE